LDGATVLKRSATLLSCLRRYRYVTVCCKSSTHLSIGFLPKHTSCLHRKRGQRDEHRPGRVENARPWAGASMDRSSWIWVTKVGGSVLPSLRSERERDDSKERVSDRRRQTVFLVAESSCCESPTRFVLASISLFSRSCIAACMMTCSVFAVARTGWVWPNSYVFDSGLYPAVVQVKTKRPKGLVRKKPAMWAMRREKGPFFSLVA